MDSLMYEVDRVSAMIAGTRALIPIDKSLGKRGIDEEMKKGDWKN